jgi:protein-tyrosine phosphatase
MRTEQYWIEGPWGGRLAIMPRPRGGDWLEDEVRSWRRSGVDVVVSLLTRDEIADMDLAQEDALSRANGIEFREFPINDREVPASQEAAARLVAQLGRYLAEGKRIAIQCRQGIGRAGLIAAALLVQAGIDAGMAIQRVSAARGCPVPETVEQVKWISDFAKATTAPLAKEERR